MVSSPGRILLLCLAGYTVVHAQKLTIAPCGIAGVSVAAPPSVEYFERVDEVAGPSRPANLDSWLPFGIAITNHSSQNIVALVVRWSAVNAQGQVSPLFTGLPEMFEQPGKQIAPGKSAIAVPFAALIDSSRLPRQIRTERIGEFQGATKIEATLDGVVFASGQFAGPNAAKGYEEFVAETTVPAHVASTILAMRESGEAIGTVVAWLETSSQAKGRDPATQIKARTARLLANSYKRGGEALLYEVAAGYTGAPSIHLFH